MNSAAQPVKSSGRRRSFSFRRSRTSTAAPKPVKAVNGMDSSRWLPSRGELQNVFKKFDANSDGLISASELRSLMASMGQKSSEEEVSSMMKEADSDGDGFISFDEFYETNTKGVNGSRIMKDLERAFKMYDLDSNGLISVQELHKVLQSLGEKSSLQDCNEMIKRVDMNADGLISFDEFMTMMSSPHP